MSISSTPTEARSRDHGCRIEQFLYLGYAALALENDQVRITLLPGKGADVMQFLYKPLGVELMWASQPGLQPAGSRQTSTGNTFLDNYPGGWQEILPNFGEPCAYRNRKLGLHDEISMLSWNYHILKDDIECVAVQLEVRCVLTPFRIQKTLTLRPGRVLEIEEELVNESGETMDCTWGHHPTFGAPFLDESCRVAAPPCRVKTQEEYVSPNSRLEKGQDCEWPIVRGRNGENIDLSRVPSKEARSHDMAYLYGFRQGWFALFNERRKLGFGLNWDGELFKFLWFWQVYGGWDGPPWHGTSYNLGLEPCSSYPSSLAEAIRSSTQLVFAPGQSVQTRLQATVISDLQEFVQYSQMAA